MFLGHDLPKYPIELKLLIDNIDELWIHCKNKEAVSFFNTTNYIFNYFWHQNDDMTLTSKNNIWAFPGKQPINNSIAVMPELFNDDTTCCLGICSDFIKKYNV